MTELQPMTGHIACRDGRDSAEDAKHENLFDPYNLNSSEFNGDIYLHKLMKECNLTHLMQKEQEIFRQIQLLDSEMQTLVYENYNKFIYSTDTIRKMKQDFNKMEEEMDHLTTNMTVITGFCATVSQTLQGRRQKISKLSIVHALLKKLQFLFELPQRLRSCVANENYSLAVKYYITAQKVFLQYQNMPSFHGIQKDCAITVSEIKTKLKAEFRMKDVNPKQLAVCVDLLLQLDEPKEVLCTAFLDHSKEKLNNELRKLKMMATPPVETSLNKECVFMDVLEFIDLSSEFLNDLSVVISFYEELFLDEECIRHESIQSTIPVKKLKTFVEEMMSDYFSIVKTRILLENTPTHPDNAILVLTLERFHRQVETMTKHKLLHDTDFSATCIRIITSVCKDRCNYFLEYLKKQLAKNLLCVRQNLAVSLSGTQNSEGITKLGELLNFLETSILENIKEILCNLQCFIKEEVTFSNNPGFTQQFCETFVREKVVVSFFKHLKDVVQEICISNEKSSSQPQLVLLLSKICRNFENSLVAYVMSLVHDQFKIPDREREGKKDSLTSVPDMCLEMKVMAQNLIKNFVHVQGLCISQMLRKSIETRDFMNSIETRNVRAVMKRVIEDITVIDSQVEQMYEETGDIRNDKNSDSLSRESRHTHTVKTHRERSKYNCYLAAPSGMDNTLMSNIQKLFSERIDIFSTIEFTKISIMTGIIKISLKTYLECVRLRTFNKYGLQSTQVDVYYLQLYLLHFVADENLVHLLLDEIINSTMIRCIDPVLMEPSVVELICERG